MGALRGRHLGRQPGGVDHGLGEEPPLDVRKPPLRKVLAQGAGEDPIPLPQARCGSGGVKTPRLGEDGPAQTGGAVAVGELAEDIVERRGWEARPAQPENLVATPHNHAEPKEPKESGQRRTS